MTQANAERLVAGLMSGTSLDGVDAAVATVSGSGQAISIKQHAFTHVSYPDALRDALLRNSDRATSSVYDLSQLNVRLAGIYAEAVRTATSDAGFAVADLDLVGSHGQTVHHLPEPDDYAGAPVRSTLQIGAPSVLANRLSVPVVGNFRLADMALGGQGAPLAPYFDYAVFSGGEETRGLLNLGGIANLTLLPPNADRNAVQAFDTGPGNMVIDALASELFDEPYDPDGTHAAQGTVDNSWLADLLNEDYFNEPPPKSTGRERFGEPFAHRMLRQTEYRAPEDIMATATMLTAASVYQAYARFMRADKPLDVVIVSGGGVHNDTLMSYLQDAFDPIPVRSIRSYGIDPDAKEALCFAVLAHETLNGVPTNLPSVTGAEHPTLLGTISHPAPSDSSAESTDR